MVIGNVSLGKRVAVALLSLGLAVIASCAPNVTSAPVNSAQAKAPSAASVSAVPPRA